MRHLVAGVPWRSAGVLLLALLPGAYAWWTGRWLVRLRDDAALPERLQARGTRLAQLVGVAFAVTAILWPSSLLWAVPLLWLGFGVGSFPARRVLFEERWTLAEYLLARLRLVAGPTPAPGRRSRPRGRRGLRPLGGRDRARARTRRVERPPP